MAEDQQAREAFLAGGEGWRDGNDRRQSQRRQQERRSVPQEVEHVAKAAHATHLAIMAMAVAQDRLERLRADRKAEPEDVSDASQRFRKCEAHVSKCVSLEVEAHRRVLNDLTSSAESITINVTPQPRGAHDAQSNPSGR
jgi:hypothetical protein